MSVRTRFEVFKRDRFTCQYCGKTPPDVLLEADHIVPRAAGGSDDLTNLTTACWECNRGKADRLLEEGTEPIVGRAQVDTLRERLEQAAAYTELVGEQESLVQKQSVLLNSVWAKAFNARDVDGFWTLDLGRFPDAASLRKFIRAIPIHEIVAAVDITASRFNVPTDDACRFFYKVCWRRIKGETGPIDAPGPVADPHEECNVIADHYRDRWIESLEMATRHLDRIGDLEDQVRDLNITVRRLREDLGRDV